MKNLDEPKIEEIEEIKEIKEIVEIVEIEETNETENEVGGSNGVKEIISRHANKYDISISPIMELPVFEPYNILKGWNEDNVWEGSNEANIEEDINIPDGPVLTRRATQEVAEPLVKLWLIRTKDKPTRLQKHKEPTPPGLGIRLGNPPNQTNKINSLPRTKATTNPSSKNTNNQPPLRTSNAKPGPPALSTNTNQIRPWSGFPREFWALVEFVYHGHAIEPLIKPSGPGKVVLRSFLNLRDEDFLVIESMFIAHFPNSKIRSPGQNETQWKQYWEQDCLFLICILTMIEFDHPTANYSGSGFGSVEQYTKYGETIAGAAEKVLDKTMGPEWYRNKPFVGKFILFFAVGIGELRTLPTQLVCFWVWEVMRVVRDAYNKKQHRAQVDRERAQMLEQIQSLKATQDRQVEEMKLANGRMERNENLIKAIAHRKLDAQEGRQRFSEVEKLVEVQSEKFEEVHSALAKGLVYQEARHMILHKEFQAQTNNRLDQNLNDLNTKLNRFLAQDTRIETVVKETRDGTNTQLADFDSRITMLDNMFLDFQTRTNNRFINQGIAFSRRDATFLGYKKLVNNKFENQQKMLEGFKGLALNQPADQEESKLYTDTRIVQLRSTFGEQMAESSAFALRRAEAINADALRETKELVAATALEGEASLQQLKKYADYRDARTCELLSAQMEAGFRDLGKVFITDTKPTLNSQGLGYV
ncbi:hypothetical protein BGX38DRAFT_1146401 [Terfezia claveryi]|nr:hypothetical protein BGX38DRAFT_1146401 [Terfezia claveryi]